MRLQQVLNDLNHHDRLIRRAAYTRLLDAGHEVVPDLVEQYEQIDGSARLSVLRVLGDIGDERAVPLLLEAMNERRLDSYFMTPSLAARSLGKIGGERAVEGLHRHIQQGNATVRRMATMVLGHIGTAEAIEILSMALEDDDPKVSAIAYEALESIGTAHAYAVLFASSDDTRH